MAVKINGQRIEGKLSIITVGKLYHFKAEDPNFSFGLIRSDRCELELAAHIFGCTVTRTFIESGYGKTKHKVIALRVDSVEEKDTVI